MALVNEINVGRFGEGLRKLFNMIGVQSPSPQLAPEIVPTLNLLDTHPEAYFLRDERLAYGRLSQSGAIGTRSAVAFRNPLSSGVLVILEAFMLIVDTTEQVNLRQQATVPGTVPTFPARYRDQRLGVASVPVMVARTTTDFAGLADAGNIVATYNPNSGADPTERALPLVLAEGNSILFESATANVTLTISIRWRERGRTLVEV